MLQKCKLLINGSIFVTILIQHSTMQISSSNLIIGKNLNALRLKMGLTQEILAKYLDTSREQISYYEIGQRTIPTDQLTKLSNLFCMDEFDFFEEGPENQKVNLAFAFRADELTPEDLHSIAQFKKIVHNYLSMKTAKRNE